MPSVLGGIGVGFGEEMITRGAVLTALRSEITEGKVWLHSTLAFSALHLPNALFSINQYDVRHSWFSRL
jgi:membrane protease YdiL (CAAX protease family)